MIVEQQQQPKLPKRSLHLIEEEYDNDITPRSKMVHQDVSSLVIIPKEEAEVCSTQIIQKKILEGETATTTTAVTTMTSCLQFSITSISSENCISLPPSHAGISLAQTPKDNQTSIKNINQKDNNNINSNETYSPSQSYKNSKVHQMNQVLKVIEKKVKTPRIYSFYYRRKKLGMKPADCMNFSTFNEALLFGNISIEENYENDDKHQPVTASSRVLSVFSSVKDLTNNCLELKFTTTHQNQHINCKFLVDHFKRMSLISNSPSPMRLSRALADYQKLLQNRILPHIGSTNRMMSNSPESIEEITTTLEIAENQLRKRLSALEKDCNFYKYVIQKVNFTTKQLDTTSIGWSFGLLELLQVSENETDLYIHENIEQLIQFECIPNGQQRMENTANIIEAMTKQLRSTSVQQMFIRTMKNTYIPVIASTEYLYPSDILQDIPSWMHYTDILGYTVKYTIIKNEIEVQNYLNSMINLQNTNINKNYNCNSTCEDFEQSYLDDNAMNDKLKHGNQQSMEFLEKYYPNYQLKITDGYPVCSNQIKKKTLE